MSVDSSKTNNCIDKSNKFKIGIDSSNTKDYTNSLKYLYEFFVNVLDMLFKKNISSDFLTRFNIGIPTIKMEFIIIIAIYR